MSSKLRLLDLVKPFLPIIPEVEIPYQRVSPDDKAIYSVVAALGYFVLAELPVFGAGIKIVDDPFTYLRPLIASNHGSLIEFGVLPLLTSGLLMQLLAGIRAIDVNFDLAQDRELFQSSQKLLALVLTFAQSIGLVFAGYYGSPQELGIATCLLISVQLIMAGLLVVLLDELIQKGYSYGSGIFMFSGVYSAQTFLWHALSLKSEYFDRGREFVGAIPSLIHALWTRPFKQAIMESFYRTHLPNLLQIYTALLAFAATVYLTCFRVDLPIKSTRARMPSQNFPVKLLYTGNISLLAVVALSANVIIFSYIFYQLFPENVVVRTLGVWMTDATSTRQHAVSGIAYFLQPPTGIVDSVLHPIKTIIYAIVVITVSTLVAKVWSDISGSAARDLSKMFKAQDITLVGHREQSVTKELAKYIPVAAAAGGAVLGAVVVAVELLGANGLGISTVVGTLTMLAYMEILSQEGAMPNMEGL